MTFQPLITNNTFLCVPSPQLGTAQASIVVTLAAVLKDRGRAP